MDDTVTVTMSNTRRYVASLEDLRVNMPSQRNDLAPVVKVSREATVWLGPIAVARTDAMTIPITEGVSFALLPRGDRPGDDDWADAVVDPAGTGALGLMLEPVDAYGEFGVWVKVTAEDETPVLQPYEVGFVRRT